MSEAPVSGRGPDKGVGLEGQSEAGTERGAATGADAREAAASTASEDTHPAGEVRQRIAGGPSRAASEAGDEGFHDAQEAVLPDADVNAHAPGAASKYGWMIIQSTEACPSRRCMQFQQHATYFLKLCRFPPCHAWEHCLPGAPSVPGLQEAYWLVVQRDTCSTRGDGGAGCRHR